MPGDTYPFQSTALYTRANGYLKELHADIGDYVEENQLLAVIDSPEVDSELLQSKAEQTKAQSDFDFAKITLERFESAIKSNGITKQQLDEKRAEFNNKQSILADAKENVKRLSTLQGFKNITSPFPGIVSTRNYDIGALVSPSNTGGEGKELFKIDRIDIIKVYVNVPQAYIKNIQVGEEANFIVNNYAGKEFKGMIARTAGSLNQTTRTLRVEVNIDNKDKLLSAGMYGQIKFTLKSEGTLLVPTSSVLFDSNGTRVVTVNDQNKITFKKIVLGNDYGTEIEVLSGIVGSDKVIGNPGQRLVEGGEVAVIK